MKIPRMIDGLRNWNRQRRMKRCLNRLRSMLEEQGFDTSHMTDEDLETHLHGCAERVARVAAAVTVSAAELSTTLQRVQEAAGQLAKSLQQFAHTPREQTGLKDRDGTEIREGDIVEFRVDYGWDGRPTYDTPEGTRMVDTVHIIDGVACFVDCDSGDLARASTHAAHCRVIGNIHDAEDADQQPTTSHP